MQRSAFLTSAAVATVLAATAASADVPGGTDLVEVQGSFDEKAFIAAIDRPADIRQLWDTVALRPGVLNNIKNSLNNGPSVTYTYSDYVWTKYGIGDFFDFKDANGNRIAGNIFYPRKFPASAPRGLEAENGLYQDSGISALQERGVVFLTCHTAVEEQSRLLIKAGKAPAGMSAADVAGDILSHLIPGAVVVPGGVGTLAVLQHKYGYTYATVQ
jgi:intracellular sulfur oxidation DsrE/DsrF family protein